MRCWTAPGSRSQIRGSTSPKPIRPGWPPTIIYYGEYELLVDDSKQFAERARAAGVDLELRSLPEGQHNFFLGAGHVPEITAAVAEIGAWVRSKVGLALATA